MKKRLMTALATGGLITAMAPSVAMADPPGARGENGPDFMTRASCDYVDGGSGSVAGTNPAGRAQAGVIRGLRALAEFSGGGCEPGTFEVSFEKVD